MPYVEVWVDDPECNGKTCGAAHERDVLEGKIEEAVDLLRAGDAVAALSALTDDPACGCKSPKAIARAYEQWKTGKLEGFIPPPGAAH